MSSILKALKKVEDVQPEPRRTENWSHAFDSREAIRRQARRSRVVRTGLAALCAVLVLGVAGWWFSVQGPKPGGGPGQPSGKTVTGKGAGGTAARGTPTGVAPAASKPAPARTARAEPPAKASPPARPAAAVPAARKTPVPVKAEPVPPPRPEAAPRAARAVPSAPAASGEQETTERLDTSGFRLEAIVWSSDPAGRFAVINGSILRQGGTMDGLTVTSIERNSVKLRSGSKAGEIRFNRN